MINEYVWKLYLASEGNKVVSLFEQSLAVPLPSEYIEEIERLTRYYCAAGTAIDREKFAEISKIFADEILNNEDDSQENDDSWSSEFEDETSCEEIEEIFYEQFDYDVGEPASEKERFSFFSDNIEWYTTYLMVLYPGLFVPYYFFGHYNVLSLIADAFSIKLPKIPKKTDYKGRVKHYVEICKVLYEFRKENNLSFCELCAFLYDFAPHYIGGIDSYIITDLPAPRSAYFVGGGGKNGDQLAEDDPEKVSYWQCNPDTRAGDMIVMYLRTPISSISSVWRSLSVGFIDPFFYYYRCTFIGRPIKIPRISIDEIKKDTILGKMPIVAGNMQGINGVELKPSEYNYIIEKSRMDIIKLEYSAAKNEGSYANEREVEEKLIKPILSRLGYSETEYVRQMYIVIGNHNHALIPDFVIYPVSSGGHYSGYAIIEAKRSIKNEKALNEAKLQARSYAKLLGAKYSIIASQEKLWVTSNEDDYTNTIFEQSWEALSDADVFFGLRKILEAKIYHKSV